MDLVVALINTSNNYATAIRLTSRRLLVQYNSYYFSGYIGFPGNPEAKWSFGENTTDSEKMIAKYVSGLSFDVVLNFAADDLLNTYIDNKKMNIWSRPAEYVIVADNDMNMSNINKIRIFMIKDGGLGQISLGGLKISKRVGFNQ